MFRTAISAAWVVSLGTAAWAAPPASNAPEGLDNYDAGSQRSHRPLAPLAGAGQVRSVHSQLGVPTVLWTARQAAPSWVTAPEGAALAHLSRWASTYRMDADDLEHLQVQEVHDVGFGPIIVRFQTEVDGIPVFRDQINVAMDDRFNLVGITGYVSPFLAESRGQARYPLSPIQALSLAVSERNGATGLSVAESWERDGWSWFQGHAGSDRLGEPTRVRPVWYPDPTGLMPAYQVESSLDGPRGADMYTTVVDAVRGQILFRKNLTESHPFSYRVYADAALRPMDGPNGNDEIPDRTGTPVVPPRDFEAARLLTLDYAGIPTQDPWMEVGATETRGNNADAYVDLNSPDGLNGDDFRAEITDVDTFDHPFDPELAADANDAQRKASIVHAFYVVNWLHDDFYANGFDEVAGNGQRDNYGRGGRDRDELRVEIQDYSGTNNANMSTPSDGARPRMQMYRWSGSTREALRGVSPASLATDYDTAAASFGPSDYDLTAEVVNVVDSGGFITADACDLPIVNAGDLVGKIAVVSRGNCEFLDKVQNVESAGAVGVIIVDNVSAAGAFGIGTSIDPPPQTIPTHSMTLQDGTDMRTAMASGTVEMRLARDGQRTFGSSLDTLVVAHEWGHYISNRLIANSSGLYNRQGRGMGEGWADFHGLLTTVEASDLSLLSNPNFEGAYGGTSYVGFRQPFFGIRRATYSRDFAKNAYTFRHIQLDEPLPTSMPLAYGQDGSFNNRVHSTGEIWGTILWGIYSDLLTDPRFSFEQAREGMKKLLVAGYKLTPAGPTLVEARDGILLAALGSQDPIYSQVWDVFASRGMGVGAQAPDRNSTNQIPVGESFEVGGLADLTDSRIDDEAAWCDREGVLDSGETGRLELSFENLGTRDLVDPVLTVRPVTPGLTVEPAEVTLPPLAPFENASTQVEVSLAGLTDVSIGTLVVEVFEPDQAIDPVRSSSISFLVHADVIEASTRLDDVEAPTIVETYIRTRLNSASTRFERVQDDLLNHHWHGTTDPFGSGSTLETPDLNVSSTDDFVVRFDHRYDIEATYDGAVLEISTDGGVTWEDVSTYVDPGYDGPINGQSNNPNPIRGRNCYNGRNVSYPAYDPVELDFGSTFAGQTVRFRFRVGSDWAVARDGWDLDDIEFRGITNTPFPNLTADRGICVNRPPVAVAGRAGVAVEGSRLTLDATGSFDPDGDPITVEWSQVDGPEVTLDPASGDVTLPQLTGDAIVRFALRVFDGTFASEPDLVELGIDDVNQVPQVTVRGPARARPATEVALVAEAVDPEEDPLTFRWFQLEGPPVTAATWDGPELQMTLPDVVGDTETRLRFSVVVSDGLMGAAPVPWTLTVGGPNRAPGPVWVEDLQVQEGRLGSLAAFAEDPDGDALEYVFRQRSHRSLEGVTDGRRYRFTAPQVGGDLTFPMEVVATDGLLEGPATEVTITVVDVPERPPHPPVTIVPPPGPDPASTADAGGCACLVSPAPTAPWLLGAGALLLWVPRFRRRRR